ncbi:IS3 family transposase [Chloroflexota bacterium]
MAAKDTSSGLLHHSDRGSQYCSYEYRNILDQFDLKASMSGKGNCFGNAQMEGFWGTLKQELVHRRHYGSRLEAIRDISEYIEIFYDRSVARPDCDSCRLQFMQNNSMPDYWQYERSGVHY